MAGIDDLLGQYLGASVPSVPDKKSQVISATDAKKNKLRGYQQGAAMDVGLRNGSIGDLILNPGTSEERNAVLDGRADYMEDASRSRDFVTKVGDGSVDLANGVMQGVLGIGAAGGGIVDSVADTNIGGTIAGAGEVVGEFSRGLQSDALAGRRDAYAARDGITTEHNAALEQEEISNGSSELMAGLRRAGRDFSRGFTNTDKAILGSGVASGIGSLLLGGVMGKGLKALGAGKAAMPVSIGALEGGGAYQQTVSEVMGMSHEQLTRTSPEYAQLIAGGMTPQDAQQEIANNAGLLAASIQAPVGIATGALVSKFEASPFAVPTVKTAIGNVLREGLEEGIQSGSGQVSSNLGVQTYADENRELAEGLGGAAAEGTMYGLGTAGVVQTPGLPGAAAMDVGRGVKAAGKAAYGAAKTKAEDLLGKIDSESPLAPANMRARIDDLRTTMLNPEAIERIKSTAMELVSKPAEKEVAVNYVDRVSKRMQIDPAEVDLERSPLIKDIVSSSTDRFDALSKAAAVTQDENATEQDKLDAGVYLLEQLRENGSLFQEDLPAAREQNPELDNLQKLEQVITDMGSSPAVLAAIEKAKTALSGLNADQIDDTNVETVAKGTAAAPETAKLEVVDKILETIETPIATRTREQVMADLDSISQGQDPDRYQSLMKELSDIESGKPLDANFHQVPAQTVATLKATQALLQSEEDHKNENDAIEATGLAKNPNIVSEGIKRKGENRAAGFLSGRDHQNGILAAWHAGNKQEAAERLNNLKKFAQHLQNKVQSLNESYAKGDGFTEFKYQSLVAGTKKFRESEKGLLVNPEVPQSVGLAQQIESDAKVITNLANKLADIFGELGVDQLEEIRLDEALRGKVRDVVVKHRKAKWRESRSQSEPAADTRPAPREAAPAEVVSAETTQDKQIATDLKSETIRPEPAVKAPVTEEREVAAATETKEEASEPDQPNVEPTPEPEAAPEPEPEPVQTEDRGQTQSILERLHQLPGKQKNWFVESFDLAPDISRLAGVENPIEVIDGALKTHQAWVEMASQAAKGLLTPELSKQYRTYLKAGKNMIAVLESRLQSKGLAKNSKGRTIAQILTDGETEGRMPNRFVDKKVLNLIEQNEDGSFNYSEPLLKSAVLAALQWVLTAEQRNSRKDDEAIGKMLGIPELSVTPEHRDFFNTGIPTMFGQRELADLIRNFWGVKAKQSALSGDAQGILDSMAAEMLHALREVGLIEQIEEKFNNKTYIQITLPEIDLIESLKKFPTAIEQAVLTEAPQTFFLGSPPKSKSRTQLRNRQAPLTRSQKSMIEREEQVAHRLHMPTAKLYASFDNFLVELFGGGQVNEQTTNKNHAKRINSQNKVVTSAFKTLIQMMEAMENRADELGTDLGEIDIFYEYEISRVNRLHMQGANNPQANKIMREVILPTIIEVDLTDPAKLAVFKLAMGQHWGLKVDGMFHTDIEAKVDEMVGGDLKPILDMLQDWDKQNRPFTAAEVAQIKEALGDPKKGGQVAPAALSAALEYARYLNASPEGKKAFKTGTYIEADGKTDGPINALMHMVSGLVTPEWLRNMEKGGLFFGKRALTADGRPMSMNDYVALGNEAKVDLYGVASARAQTAWMEAYSAADAMTKRQMDHLSTLMLELETGFEMNDKGDLELTRGLVKNPVTIKIYGSGNEGIAGNIANEMVAEMYRRMSEGQELSKAATDALAALMGSEIWNSKNGKFVKDKTRIPGFRMGNPNDGVNYTFSPDQTETLTNNILSLLVDGPLSKGIEAAIGETSGNVKLLQQATALQSIFLARTFNEAVQKKLATKDEASDGLTYAEIDEIWAQMKHLNPLIETRWQTFTPAPTGKADINDVSFGRSLTGNYRLPGQIPAPMNAGVGGIPMMIIGPGDGVMIQIFSNKEDRPKTLLVFDGIDMSLNDIMSGSRLVNESVLEGWLDGNPLADVSKTFTSFLESLDLDELKGMSNEMRLELAQTAFGRGETAEKANPEDVYEHMISLAHDLRTASESIQRRKDLLKQLPLSVDHMATAMQPHVQEGKITLNGTTHEEIAREINNLLRADQQKAPGTAEQTKPAMPELEEALTNMGELHESGARTADILELRQLVRNTKLPREQRELLNETLKTLTGSEYRVTFGTLDQIIAQRESEGLNVTGLREDGEVHGFQVPAENRVYLITPSGETLLHELIHAATFDKLVAFYKDPSTLSQEQQDAVRRIEALMYQWIGVESSSLIHVDAIRAHEIMLSQVNEHLAENNMPKAVNEFMAWTLANQDLAVAASKLTIAGKIAQLTKAMIAEIRKLVFGKAKGPAVGTDLLSNLRFNTEILMIRPPSIPQQLSLSMNFHSTAPNTNPRVRELRIALAQKVGMYVNNQVNKADGKARFGVAQMKAFDVAEDFRNHGFRRTAEENATFQMMVAVLATQIELDPNALARANQLYAGVTRQLTEEMFMADPSANNQADRAQAQEKLNALLGTYLVEKDEQNRSTLFPSFLALATVNEQFRQILAGIKIPRSQKDNAGTADAILDNWGTEAMDWLMKLTSGEGELSTNVQEAMDALTDQIAHNLSVEQNLIQKGWSAGGRLVDRANDLTVEYAGMLNDKAFNALDEVSQNTNNQTVRNLAELGKFTLSIASEKNGDIVAQGVISAMNKTDAVPRSIREVLVEIIGRTASNANIYDMIKRVRSYVQQTRQQFREHQPKVIRKAFSRQLSKEEWTALTKGLARTDIAALVQGMSVKAIAQTLSNDRSIDQLISKLEGEIQTIDPANWSKRQQKAKELAQFMNGGKPSGLQLRNAHAVAALMGPQKALPVTDALVEKIDQLISLYAVKDLDAETKTMIRTLLQDEAEGMDYTLSFLVGQRKDEMAKALSPYRARSNYYKGHVPLENDAGSSLIVAPDTVEEQTRLKMLGYTRVGDYEGSRSERGAVSKGYYFTSVSTRSPFKQGIMQNVRKSAYGIDPHTGYTMDSTAAGVIENPNEVRKITRLLSVNGSGEPLLPVFDADGVIVAYERSVAPEQHERLNINTDLAEVLGIWRGRQVEEHYADRHNNELIANLATNWNKDKLTSKAGEYIDLFGDEAGKDKVLADAVRLITPESREMVRQHFPDGKFMVRKDLVNDAVGYRSVSVGDAFTDISRLNPEVQAVIRNILMSIFGKDAFRKVVRAEKLFQTFVADAKVTIVVKSVIVPAANIASNVVHLAARGVPLHQIARGFTKKAVEVETFHKGQLTRIKLEADLRTAEGRGDAGKAQQIRSEMQAILDANRRLSIWPLIEAGELASISDTGISHEDTLLAEGKISEYIEALTERLPDGLKTAAKYGMVARDTSLFKGLQKTVEYGDFLAKAVLYDDLTKRQRKSKEYALSRVTEEFINYDRQPGRTRGYLEDMGLTWFWNFKLRAMKVALSTIRNNPVHAALAMMAPVPDSIGTVLTDNALMVMLGGNAGYSLGVDQLLHAHSLSPLVNLTT